MASINFKNAVGVERGCEDGFGGIDLRAAQISSDRLASLSNFDILPNGSIKTRRAYRNELSFSAPIRAVLSSGTSFYCLAGNKLTVTHTESGSTEQIAELETETGEAELFFFGGDLCLLDSEKFYRYDGTALTEMDGYAPLYGKEWHPSDRGEVYEDINPASDRIRISYLTDGNHTEFDLGIATASLDRVELDGKVLNITAQGIVLKDNVVDFTRNIALAANMHVTFWLTLERSATKRSVFGVALKSFVFSNEGHERLCLFSPGVSDRLICSCAVGSSAIYESQKSAPSSTPLYLASSVRIGNGGAPITGMAHHFDRAILFTDANAWCIDFEGNEGNTSRALPRIFLLNSGIGADSLGTAAHCDNDPLALYRGKLFRWHSLSGVRDECSAELISEPIAELIPKGEGCISMLSIPHLGLALICDPEDSAGSLLVYNTVRGSWCSYSGIFAEKLFIYASSPAFSIDGNVYIFSDEEESDIDEGKTSPIVSSLRSHYTDLGSPEKLKHSVRILIDGELGNGAELELETERGEKKKITLAGASGIISERISMPRFKKLRYGIECIGACRINNIILSAK